MSHFEHTRKRKTPPNSTRLLFYESRDRETEKTKVGRSVGRSAISSAQFPASKAVNDHKSAIGKYATSSSLISYVVCVFGYFLCIYSTIS